ncbi:unnamed protein product, partial [Rotaria sordida]
MKGNNIAFFGLTSTGESTMLDSLLGEKKAATDVGETTLEVISYFGRNFVLRDIPSRNDESTIKENSSIMKLLDAIGT